MRQELIRRCFLIMMVGIWYTGNRIPPHGENYPGHREIWLQEFDLKRMGWFT